jgi:2'-5' RNA ligase
MGYAVLLYFDPEAEQIIWNLRNALIEYGISSKLDKSGHRPHISLAGFSNIDQEMLISLVKEFATDVKPFDVRLSAVGTFPTEENVLFLSPVPTFQLLTYHDELHQRLTQSKLFSSPYYAPGNWIPHCTVEMHIPDEQFPKAIEICKQVYKPMTGQIQGIGVIEYPPLTHLAEWSLPNGTL